MESFRTEGATQNTNSSRGRSQVGEKRRKDETKKKKKKTIKYFDQIEFSLEKFVFFSFDDASIYSNRIFIT